VSNSGETARGFSLLEVMISVALVGLIGAGAFTVVSVTTDLTTAARARAAASSEASATLDRVVNAAAVSSTNGGSAVFCQLVELAGGPMDATAGAASGTCPLRSVANIPVAGTTMTKTVTIADATIGAASGYELSVSISGAGLRAPVLVKTWFVIGGS
jgi:prepilin-type N-terminal cleavage/methylation domain-containing protein